MTCGSLLNTRSAEHKQTDPLPARPEAVVVGLPLAAGNSCELQQPAVVEERLFEGVSTCAQLAA